MGSNSAWSWTEPSCTHKEVASCMPWAMPGSCPITWNSLLGGQPADTGVISSPDGTVKFNVLHVQKPKGTSCIQHLGEYESEKELSNYLIREFVMRESVLEVSFV